MEYVRDIASIVSLGVALFTLFGLLTTRGHDFFIKVYKKCHAAILETDQHQDDQIKYLVEMVMNLAEKIIPLYERKTADSIYEIYSKKLHGNSYAKLIYDEIVSWDIDPTGHVPEDDEDGEKV